MGSFCVGCKIENHVNRAQAVTIPSALVDTGSEYTWIPAKILEKIGVVREKKDLEFVMANGQRITRNVGFVVIKVEKNFTIDEVVFAEPGDMTLLGARTLEGLTLTVDPRGKKLVAAGPLPVAGNVLFRSGYRRLYRRCVISNPVSLGKIGRILDRDTFGGKHLRCQKNEVVTAVIKHKSMMLLIFTMASLLF